MRRRDLRGRRCPGWGRRWWRPGLTVPRCTRAFGSFAGPDGAFGSRAWMVANWQSRLDGGELAEPLCGRVQTAQRAWVRAFVAALEATAGAVKVWTDSRYVCSGERGRGLRSRTAISGRGHSRLGGRGPPRWPGSRRIWTGRTLLSAASHATLGRAAAGLMCWRAAGRRPMRSRRRTRSGPFWPGTRRTGCSIGCRRRCSCWRRETRRGPRGRGFARAPWPRGGGGEGRARAHRCGRRLVGVWQVRAAREHSSALEELEDAVRAAGCPRAAACGGADDFGCWKGQGVEDPACPAG